MRPQQHSLLLKICFPLARNFSYLILAVVLKLFPLLVVKHLHLNSYWLMFTLGFMKNTHTYQHYRRITKLAPIWDVTMYPRHPCELTLDGQVLL